MHRGDSVFLGRERELDALKSALEGARQGRGSLFLLVGEPGIGKTRLADALASTATQLGVRSHWGRAWEAGGAPAYWPWIQVLRGLVRAFDPGRAATAPLLSGSDAGAASTDPAQARFQLFERVAALVREATAREPAVLILDDLHAADPASLLLVHFLARELRNLPLLLIGTYRDLEARLNPEVGEVLARIGREGRCLPLRNLDREEVAAFIRQATGVDPSAQIVAALHRATEGNPLFVDEMLRLLGVQGGLDRMDGGTSLPIPDGVREAIRERLSYLSPQARAPLEIASVLGRECGLVVLADVCGLSVEAVRDRLAGAVSARVLVELDAARLGFSHILVREVLYRDLLPARRAALHRQVALVLERREAGAQLPLAELAHHYLEAAVDGEVGQAIAYAERAAARAMGLLAYEEAVLLLERAEALLDLGAVDARGRGEFLLALAHALVGAGESQRARARCVKAAELARAVGDTELLGRAALGYGEEFVLALVDPVLVGLLEETLRQLPAEDSTLRARAMARLASALQPCPDFRAPMRMAHQAIEMARRLGDPPTLLAVLHAACGALADFEDPAIRSALDQELVERATSVGDRVLALRGLSRLVFDHLEAGELAGADRAIAAYEQLARDFAQPKYRWSGPMFRAMRALMEGRFDEAEALALEAQAIGQKSNDGSARRCWVWHRYGVLRARERGHDFAALEPEIRALCDEIGSAAQHYFQSVRLGAVARQGRVSEAEAILASLPEEVFSMDDLSALNSLSEGAALTRDRKFGARLYDRLLPYAARLVSWGAVGMICEGPVTATLGLLAAALDRWPEMDLHFEDAIARSAAAGLRPHLARAQLEWARGLLRANRPGDWERSQTLLASGLQIAQTLGGMPDLERAIVELDQGDDPEVPPRLEVPTTPPFGLELQGDFWTITCEQDVFRLKDSRGLQILAELVASPDREFHVVQLIAPGGEGERGDAGELLDREAISAYRGRLEELAEELDEAESFQDEARASRIREERELLTEELARGVGLGGRARKASSTAERARVNVQRRVRDAIRRIGEQSPRLGKHLDWAIRTGAFCSYRPRG